MPKAKYRGIDAVTFQKSRCNDTTTT